MQQGVSHAATSGVTLAQLPHISRDDLYRDRVGLAGDDAGTESGLPNRAGWRPVHPADLPGGLTHHRSDCGHAKDYLRIDDVTRLKYPWPNVGN